ncbi:hypothetical protein OAC51_09495 [Flavobacteriaceae bacterium]|nr:hypothetical protein [Flavobacteriaceae bacterium]
MKSFLLAIIGIFHFYSFSQIKAEHELMSCVNNGISSNLEFINGKDPFDVYAFLLAIENNIQNQNLLQRVNGIGYKVLFDNILKHKKSKYRKLYKSLNRLSDSIGFEYQIYSTTRFVLTKCPYEVFFEDERTDHSFMYKHILLLNKLEAQGYKDILLLNQLIDNIDEESFSKIEYRAPIILLVMINLNTKYNRDLIRHRRKLKGKPVFGNESN